jgi:cellulose biosynthesis protein BcsQ
VDCVPVKGQDGLFLLPGHIRLSEYEVTLGIAQELSSSIQTLQNLPGSISFLLGKTAEKFCADYVLVDMSPSLSSINQNLLMTSDFFIIPTAPDYFSVMAIDSLTTILPTWNAWAQRARKLHLLQHAVYPFPQTIPRFLGTIIQKCRPRGGSPTAGLQKWIDEINNVVESKLVPELRKIGMMLPEDAYKSQGINSQFCLSEIPDFNTLIAKSQKHQTPVFALTPKQIGQTGVALERTLKSQEQFKEIFSLLADRVIGLTNHVSSN